MDARHIAALLKVYDLANLPAIKRGQVWCVECGHTQRVDGAAAIAGAGWPKHCGFTMTIDSPEERAALAASKDVREKD